MRFAKYFFIVGAYLLSVAALPSSVLAAETQSAPVVKRTQLIIKLAGNETVPVKSRFSDDPPSIILDFPSRRVEGSLPELSNFNKGVVQSIKAHYSSNSSLASNKLLDSLSIQLTGSYGYRVDSQPGRIVIEIEHPADVASGAIEVGLGAGMVLSGSISPLESERFRAMQEALNRASPGSSGVQAGVRPVSLREKTAGVILPVSGAMISKGTTSKKAAASSQKTAIVPYSATKILTSWFWVVVSFSFLGLGWALWHWRRQLFGAGASYSFDMPVRIPSGVRIIDQLVWRSFERQGYKPVHLIELKEPLGLLRIISKENDQAALLCIGDGSFFEKNTVEQFIQSMRKIKVDRGFLVAPGSFTVPAQRFAKDHSVTLIGREQLIELLGEGAMTESFAKHLQHVQIQLEDAKKTLNQYAQQLDTLRRQRNEASWFLGEERAKSAKLESQLIELTQNVRHWQAQSEHWQQAIQIAKKESEENQWYLGEAKAANQHLEEQLMSFRESSLNWENSLRELNDKLNDMSRQRDEANWYLGEAKVAQELMQSEIDRLNKALAEAVSELERSKDIIKSNDNLLSESGIDGFTEKYHGLEIKSQELAAQLQDMQRQKDESNWYLGEARRSVSIMEEQNKSLSEAVSSLEGKINELNANLADSDRRSSEANWYLGEARTSISVLEDQNRNLSEAAARLEERIKELNEKLNDSERKAGEANWYLGEVRSSIDALTNENSRLVDLAKNFEVRIEELGNQLSDARNKADEANWYLGEERSEKESLKQKIDILSAELAKAYSNLSEINRKIEENQRDASADQEAEKAPSYMERRKFARVSKSGIQIELIGSDGAILFNGVPRNISKSGYCVDTDKQLNNLQDPLQLRLYIPGWNHPIDAASRIVWQKQDADTSHIVSGYQLTEMPSDCRDAFEAAIANAD